MINIIFLGPPGSGKGTQSSQLSKKVFLPNISAGDILRAEIESRSSVGIIVQNYVDSGLLVPDNIIIDVIKQRISNSDCKNGFILDGFPRNLNQAEMLDLMLNEINKKVTFVFVIDVPSDVVKKRILGRFSCEKCGAIYNKFYKNLANEGVCDFCGSSSFYSRDDDKKEESLNNRLNIYEENIGDLIEFYKKKSLIYSIDGLKNVPSVGEEILNIIAPVFKQMAY